MNFVLSSLHVAVKAIVNAITAAFPSGCAAVSMRSLMQRKHAAINLYNLKSYNIQNV